MAYEGFTQDMDKIVEASVYIINRSKSDPNFGMTKLVKLLFYADSAAYLANGEPITGTTYLHFPHGPYPEGWYRTRRMMESSGAVTILRYPEIGYQRYVLLPNRPADLEILSPEDVKFLDEQIERFASFNASAIEEYSHQEVGWRVTEDGEPIPYELAGISAPPLSQDSIRIGLEVADDIRRR